MALPINTTSLLNELRSTLARINMQIEAAEEDFKSAQAKGVFLPDVTIYQLKNNDGSHILTSLLQAKSNCLLAISNLQRPVAKR